MIHQRELFNETNYRAKDRDKELVFREIYWGNGISQKELLDHILASETLMPSGPKGSRSVPAMSIYNSESPNLIGEYPVAGDVVPDHAPVMAVFAG